MLVSRKPFFFIRHGETEANVNPHPNMPENPPLNSKGRNQALSIRPSIQGLSIKSVCFSPLKRAIETKDLIIDQLQISQLEIEDLMECSFATWLKIIRFTRKKESQLPEDLEVFFLRVSQGLNTALNQESPTLIVAHGGVYGALCHLMELTHQPISNCQLIHFLPTQDGKWTTQSV